MPWMHGHGLLDIADRAYSVCNDGPFIFGEKSMRVDSVMVVMSWPWSWLIVCIARWDMLGRLRSRSFV